MSSNLSKRSLLKLAGWASLAATAALMGCGKKEEAPPRPPPRPLLPHRLLQRSAR